MTGPLIGAVAAAAFLVTVLATPVWIRYLTQLKYGQIIRSDGPESHLAKAGTPAMGGAIFVPAALIVALLVCRSPDILAAAALVFGYALIGLQDDWRKISQGQSLGLMAREKLILQIMLAVLLGVWLCARPGPPAETMIPVLGPVAMGLWRLPLIVLVVVGAANAVNLTDGLDGLAAGTSAAALVAYTIIALSLGNTMACLTAAVSGGVLGFLCFNRHPAKIFMGDTGSLALGAAVASAAVLTGTEFLLIVIGGVFVVETLSVIIQVASFQLTGKRVFKMSPLHHHFELCGWPETKVVRCFWAWSALLAVFGLAIWFNCWL